MDKTLIALIAAIIGGAVTAGTQIYIDIQGRSEASWSLPEDPENLKSAFVFEHIDRDFFVCYTKGDAAFVYFDNRDDLKPLPSYEGELVNYPRIALGDCEPVAGGGSRNIGFFLDTASGATSAQGTMRMLGK